MTDFSFVGTVECDRCGEIKNSSDEECENCLDMPVERYHFEHMFDDRVETVMTINARRGWHDLMKRVDEPLPWRCVETGRITANTPLKVKELWNKYNQEN